MGRPLITERNILDAVKKGTNIITIEPGSIITAAAADAAQKYHIEFSTRTKKNESIKSIITHSSETPDSTGINVKAMTIAMGSDHGGFLVKEMLKVFLGAQGHIVIDVGTDSEKACDYPDFAYAVASLVSTGKVESGIMIDSVGVGSAIVANKLPGVRAVSCNSEFCARSSREHNDANLLTLGGKIAGIELIKSIVKIWLGTQFAGGRHLPRVDKIHDIEKRFLK